MPDMPDMVSSAAVSWALFRFCFKEFQRSCKPNHNPFCASAITLLEDRTQFQRRRWFPWDKWSAAIISLSKVELYFPWNLESTQSDSIPSRYWISRSRSSHAFVFPLANSRAHCSHNFLIHGEVFGGRYREKSLPSLNQKPFRKLHAIDKNLSKST